MANKRVTRLLSDLWIYFRRENFRYLLAMHKINEANPYTKIKCVRGASKTRQTLVKYECLTVFSVQFFLKIHFTDTAANIFVMNSPNTHPALQTLFACYVCYITKLSSARRFSLSSKQYIYSPFVLDNFQLRAHILGGNIFGY